jgi:hypothetical protein
MERHLLQRARPASLRIVLASAVVPGANDPAQLAYAAAHDLVFVTRNTQDFLRLNELWTVLREWGVSNRTHAGILMPLGPIRDIVWADCLMDLLLHPNCPSLADQLLVWHASSSTWEFDHPYASQRRRPVHL